MQYRKKPLVIEAFKFDGDFMDSYGNYYVPDWAVEAYESGTIFFNSATVAGACYINTLEGVMHVSVGDYIIKGVQGEFYPCKPDIFYETYEECTYPFSPMIMQEEQ